MGLGDAEIGQQEGHGLGPHGRTTVGVDSELAWLDELFGAGFFDERGGKCGGFRQRHHPADEVAAEDIEEHVEIEVRPLHRAAQFRDVPAPQLVRCGGQ